MLVTLQQLRDECLKIKTESRRNYELTEMVSSDEFDRFKTEVKAARNDGVELHFIREGQIVFVYTVTRE